MNINYNKPCSENYEEMNYRGEKKFCDLCQKNIHDFSDYSEEEIIDTLKNYKGQEICGIINKSLLKGMAVSALIVSNLTFAEVKSPTQNCNITTQNWIEKTTISGKLIHKTSGKTIANADIYFVSKKYYLKTKSNENGEFSLEIPIEYLNSNNLLTISFDEINFKTKTNPNRKPTSALNSDLLENTSVFFSKKDVLKNKEILITPKTHYLGGLSISIDSPPQLYYLDGKRISEKKFEKLKKEHPEYQYFFFNEKEAEVVAEKSYLKSIELLFSN